MRKLVKAMKLRLWFNDRQCVPPCWSCKHILLQLYAWLPDSFHGSKLEA